MEPFLILLVVFGSTGLVVWRWVETRHKERLAMIEKGVSPADFKGTSAQALFKTSPLSSLKWGLLAMFVGIGSLVGNWLDQSYGFHDSIYLASMLIFGGFALIIFYFVAARKMKQE
ncbi:MAG: DUF6249 domain-containing protein [Bacteroidota bacterium]|jgi:hypothetical protein